MMGALSSPAEIKLITPRGDADGVSLYALWSRWDLVKGLAFRSIKTRYRDTKFGIIWAFAQPLVYMLVVNLFFGLIARSSTGDIPYPLHLLTGIVALQFFNKSVGDGASSIKSNQGIISRIYIPPIVFPAAGFLASLVDFIFPAILLAVFLMFYGISPGWNIVFLPVVLLFLFLLCSSMYLFMSVMAVRYRDIGMMVPMTTQLLLFASPVFYPISVIPEDLIFFYGINPLSGTIELLRWCLFGLDKLPPTDLLLSSAISGCVLLFLGFFVFRRYGRNLYNYIG